MKKFRVFAIAVGLLVFTGATSAAQTELPNNQLAAEWVRCQKGQASTIGDCNSIQAEFNRRANQVRQQDARIQRGEAVPATSGPAPARPAAPQVTPTPQAAPTPQPAARPTTQPSARPVNQPQQATPNLSGSESEISCEGRQVIPAPGGYMCL